MAQQDVHGVVYKDAHSNQWVAICLEYDVATQGDNEEHAVEMLKEAVELYLDGLGEEGRDILFQAIEGNPRVRKLSVDAATLLRS